mmetsp:Transcript_22427/g.45904  ORF Transcript_22427/g.45904 Transcript_22427/m.45904 type:complete len:81 (+) Transcript_22427:785-1027(+)
MYLAVSPSPKTNPFLPSLDATILAISNGVGSGNSIRSKNLPLNPISDDTIRCKSKEYPAKTMRGSPRGKLSARTFKAAGP